ncbi:MAG: hypothetical protein V7L11_19330 [Nostoc sp.]|uniref:hypothetical protein n=1 Tax=Nostoc sp. TaxID=1180 RepID=UPI002FFA2C5C
MSNVNCFVEVIQMWECCKCHEQNEENFDICWSCGTSKEGIESLSFQEVDEIAPSSIKGQPVLVTSTGIINTEDSSSTDPDQQTVEQMVCLKCGSSDIIPNVSIVTQSGYPLQVEFYNNPKAFIFKGTHSGTLKAYICGQCGYTEMYVNNAQYLLNYYRKNQKI